jgi:Kef-type K+ transport system membrane component KefB
VLCRILTELKLLGTPVGIITLSAGVGNDVVGWILLALCVALVNAGTGITALWVLLTCVGYSLFLVYAIRPAFIWILRRTRSIEDGPSQSIVALTLLLTLASAFFTNVIGVHAIFGAFMIGLICPHEGGFAIKIVEKVEDLIGALFLPLYFALSGLSTNLGLLNSGLVWGYVIGIIAVAFFGKFVGASVAARLSGLVWREAFSIGTLMSCKGLVELIVLVSSQQSRYIEFSLILEQNIGLQAKILTTQTFTMFVVMALVTTFATTPLTVALYPPWYQKKIEQWKRGEIDWDTGAPLKPTEAAESNTSRASSVAMEKFEQTRVRKLLVYLRLDNMPSILAFISLLSGPQSHVTQVHHSKVKPVDSQDLSVEGEDPKPPPRRVNAHGVRLISLTERPSSVMQVSELDEAALQDPIVNTFRTLGQLYNVPASGEVDVVPEDLFADTLVSRASDYSSDLLFLPWSESNSLSEVASLHKPSVVADGPYSRFVLSALQTAKCNTALFFSHSSGNISEDLPHLSRSKSVASIRSFSMVKDLPRPSIVRHSIRHIFCPILGGPDDLLAVGLTMQMVEKGATATIVRFNIHATTDDIYEEEDDDIALGKGENSHHERLRTEARSSASPQVESMSPLPVERDTALFESLRTTLPPDVLDRVAFEQVDIDSSLTPNAVSAAVLSRATADVDVLPKTLNSLVIVGRNWGLRGLTLANISGEQAESERCLGALGMSFVGSQLKGGFVVVKASNA